MTLIELAEDRAASGVQRGKERGRAVAGVVVGAPLGLARAHWQPRLRPIKRLDLRFLIHAEDERLIWRMEIEPDDIADFLTAQLAPCERFKVLTRCGCKTNARQIRLIAV